MTDSVDLIVVGDVMVDVSVEATALASGGHAPGAIRIRPGGSAANAAVWAAFEGSSVRLCGRVGADAAGSLVRESLETRGIETMLAADDQASTGTMLVLRGSEERSILVDPGANARLIPADLPELLDARALLVSGYTLLDPSSAGAARAALQRANAPIVAVDAASARGIEEAGADRFLSETTLATLILADEREAEALTGASGSRAAERLAASYPLAVVKLGSRGAILAEKKRILHVETAPVGGTEATGAGDAFAGVLLAWLVRGEALEAALDAACRAGAGVASSGEQWPEIR